MDDDGPLTRTHLGISMESNGNDIRLTSMGLSKPQVQVERGAGADGLYHNDDDGMQ